MPDEANNDEATRPVRVNPENSPEDNPVEQPTLPINVKPGRTQPTTISDNPPPEASSKIESVVVNPDEKQPKLWRGRLVWMALLLIIAGIALGGWLGYGQGLTDRANRWSSQVAMAAATQFQLGLEDMAGQRYEMARGRFEYVIRIDPTFPGVKEKLAEVMIALLPTAIPTITLTPTPAFTPTPDMRGEEELFNQIRKHLADKNWDTAIITIESLRSRNIKYKTVAVDGFYYIAFRNRGVDKILRQGDLEGGMYDLALTERFGPIDREADSYRLYARYYVTGASFWQIDWEKVIYYFGQVAPFLPNLRDSSNMFAIDRYRHAVGKFAEQLYQAGDLCRVSKLLDTIFQNNYRNATLEPMATHAYRACYPPTETPLPNTATPTPTSSPTRLTTSQTPAGPTFTPSPTTGGPTSTPTATGAPKTNTPTSTPTKTSPPVSTATFTPTPTK